MFGRNSGLPKSAWRRVLALTALITVLATLVSLSAATIILNSFSDGLSGAGLAASIVLPIAIGAPMSFVHLLRGAQLRLANQKLQVLASTDWLTACLNRRAFTNLVHDELDAGGAFLVIDADNFKVINDRYGHYRGDEVLQLLAATISASVRDGDIVGRLGGEEFGVFLRGADEPTAAAIAERIRIAVQNLRFAPDGETIPVSVSVGGAIFDGSISFSALFKFADQRLYGVKQAGRNRSDVAPVSDIAEDFVQALAG